MGSLSRGWMLAKMSLGVVKKDKEILVFPLISVVCMGIVAASFIFGAFVTGSLTTFVSGNFSPLASPIGIASLFSGYFLLYFVTVYFNVALIGSAMIRFEGGDPKVRDGFRASNQNLKYILMWALLAATVGGNSSVSPYRSSCPRRRRTSRLCTFWAPNIKLDQDGME